jgi:enoyl-CoA hydratase/carnithine racemase
MSELVLNEIDNGLCTLTLNRPTKLNALTLGLFMELSAHIDALSFDQVRCILLKGAGRSFCAGHDLDAIASGEETTAEAKRFETGLIERLATLPVPVVAAVRGHCLTGGLELALAADIIIAAEDAKFGDTHAKWDIVPIWGLSQRLPRRVGHARAYEMMFTSRCYSGVQAAAMGLANFCVPVDALDNEAVRLCRDILANSRRSVSAMKRLVLDTDGMTLRAGIAWELHHSESKGAGAGSRIAVARSKRADE